MSSAPPPHVVVIGAGPHGVTIGAALAARLGPDAVCLVDPEEVPLAGWAARARAIGMRRMRSPWVHHCSPDAQDLYRYAMRYGAATDQTPPVELFERHARDIAAQSGLVHRAAWVTRLTPTPEGWEVQLHEQAPVLATSVVLTGGLDPHRRSGLGGTPLPDRRAEARDGRVAIVGAGHTGASAALHVLDAGGRVDLFASRGLREQTTDIEPGWFGPRNLRAFHAAPAERRRLRVRESRSGSTTPAFAARLRALRPRGRLRIVDGRAKSICGPPGERVVTTADEAHGPYDVVYEATGYAISARNEPLLAGLDLFLCDGLPILDTSLQVLPGLHLAGALAELELGPAGRNLWGAQRAAERLCAALAP